MSAPRTRRAERDLARGLRTALALLGLYLASTGQVGSCAGDHRDRPIQRVLKMSRAKLMQQFDDFVTAEIGRIT